MLVHGFRKYAKTRQTSNRLNHTDPLKGKQFCVLPAVKGVRKRIKGQKSLHRVTQKATAINADESLRHQLIRG
jgi:hypothetical protein